MTYVLGSFTDLPTVMLIENMNFVFVEVLQVFQLIEFDYFYIVLLNTGSMEGNAPLH
jgi:hypothetical protein